MCQIAISKSTGQDFFFTLVTLVRKITQLLHKKIGKLPFFIFFIVFLERAIWQPMWCSQGSVLQFSQCFAERLRDLFCWEVAWFFWGGCVIVFVERLRDFFFGGCVIFFGKVAWFFFGGCVIFYWRGYLIFIGERLHVFFGGEVAWFFCGEVAWFLCGEVVWLSHSLTQVAWFIFVKVAWFFCGEVAWFFL